MNDIDYKFISDLEGGRRIKGYVPAVLTSNSGVTIATGFDLGQRNINDLKKLGIDLNLINKLTPYLGLKKEVALEFLQENPLIISDKQAESIDMGIKKEHIDNISHKYDMALRAKSTKFRDLPPQAKTVIASVSFQYGVNLMIRTPKFWSAVVEQNWKKAASELRSFGDAYPTRRVKEAELLEKIK